MPSEAIDNDDNNDLPSNREEEKVSLLVENKQSMMVHCPGSIVPKHLKMLAAEGSVIYTGRYPVASKVMPSPYPLIHLQILFVGPKFLRQLWPIGFSCSSRVLKSDLASIGIFLPFLFANQMISRSQCWHRSILLALVSLIVSD
ncbi:MAG: hypothetical protein WAL66_17350 [Nitrososphaeraceae archaeon]